MAAQHVGAGHDLPSTNGGPPSDAMPNGMENTTEWRLMMAFAQRRRPQDKRLVAHGNGTPGVGPSAVPPSVEEAEPKKKKRMWKRVQHLIFPCVHKVAEADEGGQDRMKFRSGGSVSGVEKEETQASERVDELATILIQLADNSFIPPEIEADSEDGEIEKLAGLLLRKCGDEVTEEYDCGPLFQEVLRTYGMFGTLMSAIFRRIGLPTADPGDRRPQDSDDLKTNIAVTCEVASRLSAMDTHPMSRVLGFGAQYVKEHYPLEEALNAPKDSENDDVE